MSVQIISNEDNSLTLLARLTARNGTGADFPASGALQGKNGKLLKQADVDSISVKLYDSDEEETQSATPAAATVISDTLQTTLTWLNLRGGGNFAYEIPLAWSATPGAYTLTVKVVTVGGEGIAETVEWVIQPVSDAA